MQVAACGGKRAVPHSLLDRHDIDSAHRQQRSERVSEVVEAQRTDTGCSLRATVAATQRRVIEWTPERIAEHEIVGAGEVLAPAHAIQRRCGLIGERHPPSVPGLRRRFDARAHGAGDIQRRPGEVNVVPAQGQQLALPESRVGGDSDDLGVLMILGVQCLAALVLLVDIRF